MAERSHPTSEVRGRSREDTMPEGWRPKGVTPRPRSQGQGQQLGGDTPRPNPRPRVVSGRSNPTTEARGGGREDQPHMQGAVAAWAQEGLEELSHVEGQEGQR